MPKSRRTTRPSRETRTFDGLTSRWSWPAAWRAWIPRTVCRSASRSRSKWSGGGEIDPGPIDRSRPSVMSPRASALPAGDRARAGGRGDGTARVGIPDSPRFGNGVPRTYSRKLTPSISSMVKNHWSSRARSSCRRTRFVCARSARARNSLFSRKSASTFPSRRALSATTAFRSRSSAWYTTPKPPAPRRRWISKRSVPRNSCSCARVMGPVAPSGVSRNWLLGPLCRRHSIRPARLFVGTDEAATY